MSDVLEPEKLEPEKLDLASPDIAAEKRAELLRLFPEVRAEGGKVDFDRLRMALGEAVDVGKERYGMNWPGKADCFKAIQRPSLGTLLPVREESVNFDETENLIIEGDNLEVLKLLQKSYQGKVKMIYIDPPYNTGNDFIYPDNYSESLQTYLEYTGQVDNEGRRFSNNTETDGRFHSKWINMMYPRLFLARNLLRQDGLIFVSINDVELQDLRAISNEIFGEENWLGTMVWKGATDNNPTRIVVEHEYIVCYALDASAGQGVWKNKSDVARETMLDEYKRLRGVSENGVDYIQSEFRKFIRDNAEALNSLTHYNRVDEQGPYTGSRKVHNPKPGGYKYDVPHPITKSTCIPPANGYRFPKTRMDELILEGRILFGEDETQIIQIKEYLTDYESKLSSVLTLDSRAGSNEMEALFGDRKVFPHPKPAILLREVFSYCLEREDLVLDFFAGSGTTAQAVIDLNKEDSGSRKYILVQLPEPTGRNDYLTIADITKERVRRTIQPRGDESEGRLDLGNRPKEGFRVLKLATSNFNVWSTSTESTTPDALEQQLELHIEHIRKGRYWEELLYEVLLKSGFPLTTPVETFGIEGKAVHSVANGAMLICLDRNLTHETIRAIAELKPERVVCLDEGFAGNDQLKTNAVLIMKAKGVTKFQTI